MRLMDRVWLTNGLVEVSCVFQSPLPGLDHTVYGGKFPLKMSAAIRGQLVGLTAIFRRDRLNPAGLLQTRDGAVERAWTEADTGELFNVLHHGVAVLGSFGQAGENQQVRVGHRRLLRITIYRAT